MLRDTLANNSERILPKKVRPGSDEIDETPEHPPFFYGFWEGDGRSEEVKIVGTYMKVKSRGSMKVKKVMEVGVDRGGGVLEKNTIWRIL